MFKNITLNSYHPIRQLYRGEKTFVVPDTIEGWADAIGVLVKSYFARSHSAPGSPQYRGHRALILITL